MVGLKLKLIIAAVVLGSAFLSGWKVNGWRLGEQMAELAAEQAEQAVEIAQGIIKIERLNREKSEAIAAQATAQQAAQRVKATIVTKEVLVYVQDPTTGHCELPDSWVRSHDQAAGVPEVTDTTSKPDGVPAKAVTDRDALIAVTDNYNICLQNAIRHRALIDWARSSNE